MPDDNTFNQQTARRLATGDCAVELRDGALRRLTFDGLEIVRLIDHPIRDGDWRTVPLLTDSEQLDTASTAYARNFHTADGAISGSLRVRLNTTPDGAQLEADLTLAAQRPTRVNRAGFVVLHPLKHVVGQPVEVLHSDGNWRASRFPERISASQPVFDIAGLRHVVGHVRAEILFAGEVFEMEDQRNWTDASFKTYCRPLSRPRPYDFAVGETVHQRITVTLRRNASKHAAAANTGSPPDSVIMPEIALAHEEALGGQPDKTRLAALGVQGLLIRLNADDAARYEALRALTPGMRLTLELVTGPDPGRELSRIAAACTAAGVTPARVIALPRTYLTSFQPEGPWPAAPRPMDLPPLVRAAFPKAACGGGMLTNFTEVNRCPPDPALLDFVTFGTTAIVHAADDDSVIESLEALGDVLACARAIAGPAPLRLGLMSIGMRSNPYGASVAENPHGARLPMAMRDPRQSTSCAAAFAVGVAAAVARAGAASFAPAMTAGPLGLGTEANDSGLYPLYHITATLAALAGLRATISGEPATGLVIIRGEGGRGIAGVAATLGPRPAVLDSAALRGACILTIDAAAATDANWVDQPGQSGRVTLGPLQAAILKR